MKKHTHHAHAHAYTHPCIHLNISYKSKLCAVVSYKENLLRKIRKRQLKNVSYKEKDNLKMFLIKNKTT